MKRMKVMAERLLILLKAEVDALMKPIVNKKPSNSASPDHIIRYQTFAHNDNNPWHRRASKFSIGEKAVSNALGRISNAVEANLLECARLKSNTFKKKQKEHMRKLATLDGFD